MSTAARKSHPIRTLTPWIAGGKSGKLSLEAYRWGNGLSITNAPRIGATWG